jgi:AraC-like DNA-binding protein
MNFKSSLVISWVKKRSKLLNNFFWFFIIFFFIIFSNQADDSNSEVWIESYSKDNQRIQQLSSNSLLINYGFQKNEITFSIKTNSSLTRTRTFYLIFLWSHLDEVEVCLSDGKCSKAGYGHKVSTWPLQQIFPTFPIEISPLQKQSINVKIKSKNFIESEIQLLTTEKLFELISWQTGLVFSFLILILMFLLRLIYLCFVHPKTWMFYLLGFHFSIFLIFIFGSGIANLYLFNNFIIPLSLFKKIIIGILIFFGSGWLSDYLNSKINFPKIHKIYLFAMVSSIFLIIFSFTEIPRNLISFCLTILYLGITILSISLGIIKLKDQLKPTPWLILGLLCLLFFEILNIFSYESFDSHDSKVYLFFLIIFLPANSFFVSRTIQDSIIDIQSELTLSKKELHKFKLDLAKSFTTSSSTEKKSYLNGVNIELYLEKLKNLMSQDKIFLEEELRLTDLSALLGLSVHQTSELLNQILRISFVDLLKQYRIEEAKRMLIDLKDLTILQIALQCGFNSKSVFNDTFKKIVGMPPIEFRKKNNN